jgi:hypothetical protein
MAEEIIEFSGNFSDVMTITELRGAYPNVPISADVDFDALIAGDPDPKFITLPIAKAGVTSRNGRYYDSDFVNELVRQTLTNKPIGLMGHLSESERSTAFPPEAIHWVGALREGDIAWGKGYLVPGAVRDRIQRYKAQNKTIATSIDAFAEGVRDDTVKATRMKATSLRLNQIDIAPADRAGIPDLATVPHLTKEMKAPTQEHEQEQEMDNAKLLQELRSVKVPPQKGWQAQPVDEPAQEEEQVQEMEAITELQTQNKQLTETIQELRGRLDAYEQERVDAHIAELVSDGIKLAPVRGIVTKFVRALSPKTVEEANAAYEQVVEMEEVKELLALTAKSLSGPATIVSGKVQASGRKPLEDTPENRKRAAAEMGLSI